MEKILIRTKSDFAELLISLSEDVREPQVLSSIKGLNFPFLIISCKIENTDSCNFEVVAFDSSIFKNDSNINFKYLK